MWDIPILIFACVLFWGPTVEATISLKPQAPTDLNPVIGLCPNP